MIKTSTALGISSVLLLSLFTGACSSSSTVDDVTVITDTETGTGTDENQTDTPISQNPNILLIITDDQGLDASAQYTLSNDVPNTPVINSLAANGITYDNVWATPSCTTTRASLLTGKHGINNGVTSTPGTLSATVGSIQQYLDQVSPEYQSAVFGKWHVAGANPDVNHPASLGVDHYQGNLQGNIDDYYNWTVTTNGVNSSSETYHTSALVNYAIDWIGDQTSPWFTWLAFSAPHSPFHEPPEQFNSRNLSGDAADIISNKRTYYLAAIETLDTELGRLLDSMKPEVRDNTVVMIIGDNGTPRSVIDRSAFIGSHGKGSLFEGGIRVPLVISGNGVNRTNVRESGMVSIVDFFPTIASIAGADIPTDLDGFNLQPSFTSASAIVREYLYTEFISDDPLGSGWTVRSETHKYLAYADDSEALYDLQSDPDETINLLPGNDATNTIKTQLQNYGLTVRNEASPTSATLDITDRNLNNDSPNCADHVRAYQSMAQDASTGITYNGNLNISTTDTHCIFNTNAIPNHTFNDGANPFPNAFSEQSEEYRIPKEPAFAATSTALSLRYDDAILLNGIKVDLLAAGCFGVGNGRIGCNDDNQPWRYDPMYQSNGFRVDSHNAHTQPDGTYHYHGDPNALFNRTGDEASPVVGFAADGFPIYGSFINDGGTIRQAQSSYQLKTGTRPSDNNQPGGAYDGSFRDDYEYIAGSGDLDECNGMSVDGNYGYYITDTFPYMLACFKGTVDASFSK